MTTSEVSCGHCLLPQAVRREPRRSCGVRSPRVERLPCSHDSESPSDRFPPDPKSIHEVETMIKKQLETEKDLNVTQEVRGLAARPASARLLEAARQTPQGGLCSLRNDAPRTAPARHHAGAVRTERACPQKGGLHPEASVQSLHQPVYRRSHCSGGHFLHHRLRHRRAGGSRSHRRSHRRHHGFHQRHAAVCAGSALGQRGGTFAGDGQDHHCGLA